MFNYVLITGGGNVVFFCITKYFVIHQAIQNLNYGPVMQSQGHQSMSVCTALFILKAELEVFAKRKRATSYSL